MAINRDDLEGLYSSMADEGTPTAADLMSQYFGAETPAVEPGTERILTQQEEQLQAFLEAARQQEALRAAQEGEARRALDEQIRLELERQAAMAAAQGPATNVAPPPPNTGLPPGVTQADLDAIAAQFRQAGYQDTPAINFTGDPNQPFFDMGTPEGGVDPRYFVEGLTNPLVNTVPKGPASPGEPDRQCPPRMEFSFELGRCVPIEDIDRACPPGSYYDSDAQRCVPIEPETTAPPTTTPAPTTAPPETTPPPTTASPDPTCPPNMEFDYELGRCVRKEVIEPPPTTAPPTTPPPTTTAPPIKCPDGPDGIKYIWNPETRQCEAEIVITPPPTTRPPPTTTPAPCPTGLVRNPVTGKCELPGTTAPPTTTPPPTTIPPTTPPPTVTPTTTPPPTTCPPGYIPSTITGKCVPITLDTTPPPRTTAPPSTTPPPGTTCPPGYTRSTITGQCVPFTTGTPAPTTPAPVPTTPPPGVIKPYDPSAAMLAAYNRMFGTTGSANYAAPTGAIGAPGSATSPVSAVVPTIGGGPVGGPPAGRAQPLPGVPGTVFTPGRPQFFGNVPGSMLPGTLPSNINPLGMYQGPSVINELARNPNLSPGILGGIESLGYYTDRLGNRIISPGGNFLRFAEGGPVSAAPPQTGRFYGSFGPEILNRPDRLQRALGTVNERPSLADMRYNDAQKVADINRLQAELYKKLMTSPESLPDSVYAAMYTGKANPGLRASAGGGFGGGTGGGLGYGGPTTYFPSVLNQDRKKPTVTVEEMPEADGYAEGGEAKKEEMTSESAQALSEFLTSVQPNQRRRVATVLRSPNGQSVRRAQASKSSTDRNKAMSLDLESLTTAQAAMPREEGSAAEQLSALLESYKEGSRRAQDKARGFRAQTFNEPTLDKASFTRRGPLAAKRFNEGGEVDDSTPLQRRIYMESVSDPTKRTAPITERSMSARELEKLRKLIDIAERNPALSEKTGKPLPGVVDYAHQRMLMEQVDPMGSLPISMRDSDYNAFESGNLRNTLGQFTFERLPDGTLVVKDTYDYTGDVGERFNPLVRYANKKGVNRPVEIRLPAATKKKK